MRSTTQATGWPVLALAGVLALGLVRCSSSDGNGGSQDTGTFNDGPVANLDYEIGGEPGKTGDDGSFSYGSPSDEITFRVGDIVLGTGTVKTFMTPVDIVPGAVDENHDAVTNIARFLQTLDADGNLTNGIQIPDEAVAAADGQSIDFDQTPEAFESDPNVLAVIAALTDNALVGAEDARAELRSTILARLAGDYGGSFAGDASGCWSLRVDGSGSVTGTFIVEDSPLGAVEVPLMGGIPSSGQFTLTGSDPPLSISIVGTTTTSGDATGGWTLTNGGVPVAMGTFTGGVNQGCEPMGNGVGGDCPNDNAALFVFTPFDQTAPFTVCPAAPFDCQTPLFEGCQLQVFDIDGSDRFLQFGTTSVPFAVNLSCDVGFDFVVDEPGASGPGLGRGLTNAFGLLTGREFGALDPDNPTPFATGEYAYRDGSESLGMFEFFEQGFAGFQIPVRECAF